MPMRILTWQGRPVLNQQRLHETVISCGIAPVSIAGMLHHLSEASSVFMLMLLGLLPDCS